MKQHKFTRLTAPMTPEVARKVANMNAGRTPDTHIPGLTVMNADKPLAKLAGPHVITDRYMAGESIVKVAASLGVSHIAIYDYLWRTIPNDWPKLRAARAESQYDGAVESMSDENKSTLDGLQIARARETARFRFGEMAALRREFSQKQEVTTTQNPVFNITIVAQDQPVIAVVAPQQPAIEHNTHTVPT